MEVFQTSQALKKYLFQQRCGGKIIGFVPTMGALHEGHLSLVAASQRLTDCTVCSVFVNPTQFNNPADLATYPHTPEADHKLLEEARCDVLFYPDADDVYKEEARLRLDFGLLERTMEGAHRPGHFHGVGLIIAKFFHIVAPDVAFFGQKDLQQYRIVQQLVRDLSFDVRLEMVAIKREPDGLAMSSRNQRLTPEARTKATQLHQALQKAAARVFKQPLEATQQLVIDRLAAFPTIQLEYFTIVDAQTLEAVTSADQSATLGLCLAAYVGGVRLIDNVLVSSKK